MAAFARTATVSTTILIAAGGIEGHEILANRMGCLLCLWPCKRLVAGDPTLRLDFPERVTSGGELRKMLVRLANEARARE